MKEKKLNRAWHEAHPMPRNPTREQRTQWHASHSQACGCRPVPESLAADVKSLRARTAGELSSD